MLKEIFEKQLELAKQVSERGEIMRLEDFDVLIKIENYLKKNNKLLKRKHIEFV
jgi:reverse gyrase